MSEIVRDLVNSPTNSAFTLQKEQLKNSIPQTKVSICDWREENDELRTRQTSTYRSLRHVYKEVAVTPAGCYTPLNLGGFPKPLVTAVNIYSKTWLMLTEINHNVNKNWKGNRLK